MKYLAIVLACLIGPAYAQEKPPEEKPPEGEKPPEEGAPAEGESEEEDPPSKAPSAVVVVDPKKILGDLTLANAAKDTTGIDVAVKEALAWSKGPKDETLIEDMATELAAAIKLSKGNWGTLNAIAEALGELRSKDGAKTLKKLAFKKEAKDESEEKLQATAIVALSKYADTKEIEAFGEMGQSKSVLVAKAAYTAFGSYGTAKGKVRRTCAELLMKRLDAEFPSSGGQGGGGGVSKEKQERWAEVSPAIVSSMKALCGPDTQTLNDVDNWREWWKENKKNPKASAWKDEDEKESS